METKIITQQEILTQEPLDLRLTCRDWLLGGETYQWSVKEDLATGNIILKRW